MRTLGIVGHSAEGAGLCFLESCRSGQALLGAHEHPPIVMSCLPMGPTLAAWEARDYEVVGRHLAEGVSRVADAGADLFVCPDNTAHIVLERIAATLPIPGMHIADVVCARIAARGWTRVGVLGTEWTMTGPVYRRALEERGMEMLVPEEAERAGLHRAIFDELCQGVFEESTTEQFLRAIDGLKARGAECAVLGCTEIPLIVNDANSGLPVLDSTRLLARGGVAAAVREGELEIEEGWVRV